MIIGYTTGVFDLFHVGHLNLLRNARAMCDKLIVGVTVDDLVLYKNKHAVIPYHERVEVVRACRYVDVAVPQDTMDKTVAHDRYKFDVMFVGDDWFKSDKWDALDKEFGARGARIIYMPYTQGTTSTLINETLLRLREQ
jgi:glycerol-3-phosphate cytidylyltransferase